MSAVVYAVQSSLDGEPDEVNGHARYFRAIDARGTDRRVGLRALRSLVRSYRPAEAATWLAVIDERIDALNRAEAAKFVELAKRDARNSRRRARYAERRSVSQLGGSI